MKKFILLFVLSFLSISLFSQEIYFDGEKLTCLVKGRDITGDGVLELNTKRWMEMPYMLRRNGDSTLIIIDVVYDNKWNYPVSAIFNTQKTKRLSNHKKNNIRCAIIRKVEDLYMVLTGNKKYLDD